VIYKNALLNSIITLLGINGLSYIFLFLISVIIFRTVDKSFYGLYVIMLSLYAFVELLMAGFNDSIVRFLKDKVSLVDKQNIILFVLYYKYSLIFIFVLTIYIARQYGVFEFLIGNYSEVSNVVDSFLLVAILNGVFSTFISVNNCILNAQQQYQLTANISLLRNITYFVVVVVLSFYTQNYLNYLYSNIVLSVIVLLFLSVKINNDFREFAILNLIKSKFRFSIGKKYIFSYAVPLTISSQLTYVKNHLPMIILGKEFELEDVAVFSILKTFFKALHSLSGSFIDPMMSKFLELKNHDQGFSLKMNYIFYGSFVFRVLSFVVLSLLVQYFFLIYKIEDSDVNYLVFHILGFEYIVAGMILSYGVILRLDKSTNKVLISSIARFIVELILIYSILLDYGIMAAALILFVARYVETIFTYLFIRRENIFHMSELILFIFFPVIVYYFSRLV